jgi:hypothetical protein
MNNKKQKSPAKCQAQFSRTIIKTGKWRGQKLKDGKVISYRHIKRQKPCDHFFNGDYPNLCIHCGIRKPKTK